MHGSAVKEHSAKLGRSSDAAGLHPQLQSTISETQRAGRSDHSQLHMHICVLWPESSGLKPAARAVLLK